VFSQKKNNAHEHQSLKCSMEPIIEQKQVSDNDMNCEKAHCQGIGFLLF
jgi:hypothetical protein